MDFEILGEIENVETFASGRGTRERSRLNRIYGRGNWRKRKGVSEVKLADGSIVRAEIH